MDIINNELKIFNNHIKNELLRNNDYISSELINFVLSKSKQIRPRFIFLFSKALGFETDNSIYNLACATELIHNSTLIHDDIIDKSDIRRGNETLNHKYGNSLSVLYGDILLAISMNFLTKCNNLECFKEFSNSLQSMCEGEIKQHFQYKKIISVDEYINKSKNKTAELYRASLLSLCHIKNIKELQQIESFAINYGIAFQIQDDLNNIITQDKNKPAYSDINNGIYTLPVILLADKCENIEQLSPSEIKNLIKNNSFVLDKTKEYIQYYKKSAIDSIEFIEQNQYKKAIIEIIKGT